MKDKIVLKEKKGKKWAGCGIIAIVPGSGRSRRQEGYILSPCLRKWKKRNGREGGREAGGQAGGQAGRGGEAGRTWTQSREGTRNGDKWVLAGVGYRHCTLTQDSIFIHPVGENIKLGDILAGDWTGHFAEHCGHFYLKSGRVFPVSQQFQILVLLKSLSVSKWGPAQGSHQRHRLTGNSWDRRQEGDVWPAGCSTGVNWDADSHSRQVL